ITGTAGDQQTVDAALAEVAGVHGVRSVRSEAVVAEVASPYPFTATIKDGAIVLTGGVPNAAARESIAAALGVSGDGLEVLAGAPPEAQWRAAVDYGLSQLRQFDEGEVRLSDLELTIEGRAKSAAAFDELAILAEAPLPTGAVLVSREV